METHCIREVLKLKYTEITENLKNNALIPKLFEKAILTKKEKEELQAVLANKGGIWQSEKLLDILFSKTDAQLHQFVLILDKTNNSPIKQLMINAASQVEVGFEQQIQEVWNSVRTELQKEKWHSLPPIPRETNFHISVLNDDIMMDPDTDSQVLDVDDLQKQMAFCRPDILQLNYTQTDTKTIEDVLDLNKGLHCMDPSGHSYQLPYKVQLLGEAGSGKSTHVQRLACKWAKRGLHKLRHYQGIFLIPVKLVKHNSLMDALSDVENGLGFIKEAQRPILDRYLRNPNTAKRVLLILDGVDETELKEDSDLYRVIFGKLYSGVHVMVTMRHYSETFSPTNGFIPMVRVHLKGTNRTSIERFIRAFFSQESQRTTSYIITECQSRLFDYSIAYIPLYLTMICFIFHEQRALHSTITHFRIPDTMTGVFHAFLHVILRFWLKRLSRSNEICLFDKSPILGQASQVPMDIQKTLYLMSKMSYDGLVARKYTFDASDLSQYLLSEKDIKNSGIFCVREVCGIETFFFRHKTLQEYLGGLYLAKDFKYVSSFQRMLLTAEQATKKTLYENLEPLQKCLQFAAGVSNEFLQNVFAETTGKAAIQKLSSQTVKYNIHFETSLYFEANSNENLDHIVSYFDQAPVVRTAINVGSESTTYDLKCLRYFIHHLKDEQAKKIIEKLYGINISTDRNGVNQIVTRNGVNCSSPELHGDLLLFALITRFEFPMVSTARLELATTDLGMLLKSFPNLKTLDLKAMVLESTFFDPFKERTASNSLTHISLKSVLVPVILGQEEAETNLLAQPNLTHLQLSGVNMLRGLTSSQQLKNARWPHLTELRMTDCALNADDSQLLCILFRMTPNLKVLDLSNYHSFFQEGHTQLHDCVDKIAEAIVEYLPNMEVLGLADCLGSKSVTNFTLALPCIPKLRKLTLDKRDIKGAQTNLTEGLLASENMKELIVYSRNAKKESIKRELKTKLETKGIRVCYISLYD